jgi:HSP20 family protein
MMNNGVFNINFSGEDEPARDVFPLVNLYESEAEVWAQVAVPGFSSTDIKVEVKDEYLILEGHRTLDPEFGYVQKEFEVCEFKRIIRLDANINRLSITAKYSNGMLALTLPKVAVK